MIEFSISQLLDFYGNLTVLRVRITDQLTAINRNKSESGLFEAFVPPKVKLIIPPYIAKQIEGYRQLATLAGLGTSVRAADMLLQTCLNYGQSRQMDVPTASAMALSFNQVINAIQHDLKSRLSFLGDPDMEALLRPKTELFGDEVFNAFPHARRDIKAAANCRAFGMYTAAVFHLMRAIEVGLDRLRVELNIQTPKNTWGAMLADITKEVKAMPAGRKRELWLETTASLGLVKDAWRNRTAHDQVFYSEEEAEDIWNVARSYMRSLSKLII